MTEKVLIEINRLKNELDGYSAREALDYIESYINTLSKQQVEEPVPAKLGAEHLADARKTSPKDLEEAAKRYSNNKHPMTPTGARESQEDFIAGAKWQEEKEKEYSPWLVIPKLKEAALEFGEQAKDYEIGWQSFAEDMAIAFTRGAEWQKEQMMQEAVEGEIRGDIRSQEEEPYQIWAESDFLQLDEKFEIGDKVRVIIVKED